MRWPVVVGALGASSAFLCHVLAVAAAPAPWDALTNDSWICFAPAQARIRLYTVNAGSYEVGFDQVRSDRSARGENALRFSQAGADTGHLVSDGLTGSFGVSNVGNSRTFRDLIMLVAVDASALGGRFSMSLTPQGGVPYQFDPAADFSYYSHPEYSTGRPSGYYSASSPTGEGVSYCFSSGMVTLYAATNVNLAAGGTVTFDYCLANLPGTAVFSVYGFDSSVGWIYHTNRSVVDDFSRTSPVSTFEVRPVPEPAGLLQLCVSSWAAMIGGARWRRHRAG